MQWAEGAGSPDEAIPAGADSVDPHLRADVAASFTHASHQNAIPVVRSIVIVGASDRPVEGCRVELTAEPAFLRPKSWTLDRLLPGDRVALSDRKIELDAGYLAGLDEAERGLIRLRLTAADMLLDERCFPVRLLARDEWGGVADMAQLLPAFVMPNDPAVAPILHAAAELAWVVRENRDLLDQSDPARDLARLLGVERLAAPARVRLDEAIARARHDLVRERPAD